LGNKVIDLIIHRQEREETQSIVIMGNITNLKEIFCHKIICVIFLFFLPARPTLWVEGGRES